MSLSNDGVRIVPRYRPRWIGQWYHLVVASLCFVTIILVPVGVVVLAEQFVVDSIEFDKN